MSESLASHPGITDIDPQELVRAARTWHSFTYIMKRAIVVIVLGVVVLAWITL